MIKTRSGLPKHCTYQSDASGKRRVRFRWRGISRYLHGIPWSPDFLKQYAAALEAEQNNRAKVGSETRSIPGSVSALIVTYYASPEFRDLRESTQKLRRGILERFRVQHGHRLLKDLQVAHLKIIIGEMADRPEAANNLLKVLRVVLNFAVGNALIAHNPAMHVKHYTSRSEGFHTWSETEVSQFQQRHPLGSKARLALELLLSTGQRRGDMVKMGWQHIEGDCIAVRQEKTNEPLLIPIDAPLAAALNATPRSNLTILLNEIGTPFTAKAFGNWFRMRCNEAGLTQCSAHGLRKLAATRLANAGCSNQEIKAITGHRSDASLAPYIRKANKTQLARQARERLRGAEREQIYPSAEPRFTQGGKK